MPATGAVDAAGLQDLLVRLVRERSHPGLPRQEEGVVRVLREYLVAAGLRPEVQEVVDGRPNLLCSVDGGVPGCPGATWPWWPTRTPCRSTRPRPESRFRAR
jgi:hypothetical protein